MVFLMIILLLIGFVILVKGADFFVDGSAGMARRFRVPGVIIGLTVVALGTSAPELAVSTAAAIQGSNEIALSNVVGSNIFNLLTVLGVCSIIHPLPVDRAVLKRDFPLAIVSTAFLFAAACGKTVFSGSFRTMELLDRAGIVNRLIGAVLLIVFLVYISYLVIQAKKNPLKEEADAEEPMPVKKCVLLIVLGLAMIVGGGQAVVFSAKEIARFAGMTETLIGLTIVAVGTSLPELVTSIVAARKKETGLAVGNAVGSSIFNLMFILGISSVIHPVAVNLASVWDLLILLGISVLTYIFALTKKQISRPEGAVMAALYIADVLYAIFR